MALAYYYCTSTPPGAGTILSMLMVNKQTKMPRQHPAPAAAVTAVAVVADDRRMMDDGRPLFALLLAGVAADSPPP